TARGRTGPAPGHRPRTPGSAVRRGRGARSAPAWPVPPHMPAPRARHGGGASRGAALHAGRGQGARPT
ncbi:hypothetical protein CEJ65_20625, partial [Acinetobacter baumannii]